MILEKETYKEFGYYPCDLKPKSGKKIFAKCDGCGMIRKISKYQYRALCPSCAHTKQNNPMYGKHHSDVAKEKIRKAHKERLKNSQNHSMYGTHRSDCTKKKIREKLKDIYRHSKIHHMCGKHHSEETKLKMHNAHIGKYVGENSSMWKGGVSYEPYCIKFNDDFKERVREYWDRKCVLCNKNERENGRRLDVHHVTYNKETCCDGSIPLFVALCRSCHMKTNFNEEYWENKFKQIIYFRNINGKCFFTKKEMENLFNEKKSLS